MSAPAGWYDDGSGQQRWWDGHAWGVYAQDVSSTQLEARPTGVGQVSAPVGRPVKEPGILNALGQAVKNAAVEQKSLAIGALTAGVRARREREEREREERLRQAECARMAGRRVTSGEFGDSEVEIYENGYVRVAGPSEGGRSCWMDESTPYENLIAISFERPDGGSSGAVGAVAASSVATAGTAVKVVSMIAKRNPAVMAISAAGVAAAGAGAVAKIMSAKAVLTITTDQRVHVLTNQVKHPTTGIPMPRKDHESVGAVLEQTGNSVLTALGRGSVVSNAPALPSGQAEVSQGMSSPGMSTEDVAKRLRELAELREEGILDDADFAIAKRQLLGKL
ncbi:hypothetical protein BKH30_06155 [Actinomyces oris]|uniref:Uncharacterized protein n=1 Tax=Actinomyces oris TaxID=544580 RepID=A0A1Q8VWJ3_9ACTO|nr:hypothetical protein BKH30_06155 [Actinomyces oris]